MSDTETIVLHMREALADPDALTWTDGELIAGVRQAFEDLLNASGQPWVLEGLDGEAEQTNFSKQHFALIIRGALGYALIARSSEQLAAFHFDQAAAQIALQAGQAHLAAFEKALPALQGYRLKDLQDAADAPFPDGSDDSQPGWTLNEDGGY
jgi:hypothetical protein